MEPCGVYCVLNGEWEANVPHVVSGLSVPRAACGGLSRTAPIRQYDRPRPEVQEPDTLVVASGSMGSIRQNSYTVGLMKTRSDATPLPEITFLTQEEVRRLFAVIPGKRDRALFQLAYHHGLRASEVSLLQRDDVHAKQGRIYIPRVKGSIAKTYPLQPDDLRCLRAYLRTREMTRRTCLSPRVASPWNVGRTGT